MNETNKESFLERSLLVGENSEIYLHRALTVLRNEGLNPYVTYEIQAKDDGILCGINQIIKNSGDKEIKTNNKIMKYVDYLVISPSEDLNEIAQKHYHNMPLSIRLLLQGLGLLKDSKSELLSFLLFESVYTSELID